MGGGWPHAPALLCCGRIVGAAVAGETSVGQQPLDWSFNVPLLHYVLCRAVREGLEVVVSVGMAVPPKIVQLSPPLKR